MLCRHARDVTVTLRGEPAHFRKRFFGIVKAGQSRLDPLTALNLGDQSFHSRRQ